MEYGKQMNYTIYFNNAGDTQALGVTLTDTLPMNLELVSASDEYMYDPATGNVTWNIGSLDAYPNGYGFRTVTVRIPESMSGGTVIENTASIMTTDLESNYDDNNATALTTVTEPVLPANVSLEPINGISGGIPSVHFAIPETFSFNSLCATGVDINIHLNDGGGDITGSMTQSISGVWTYTTTFYPRHGIATITYTITGCEQATVSFNIYIDPAGYIYDVATGERISGASVWLQQPDGIGGWQDVSVGQSPAVMQPDVNPLITGIDGQYQWDVLAGIYRVCAYANGYYSACSFEVSIPPPVTDLHIGLIRIPVLDNTPPEIVINIANNTNFTLNQSVLVNLQVTDLESGVALVDATVSSGSMLDTSTVGLKTITMNATDNAGNKVSVVIVYRVVYNYGGVTDPINADGSSLFNRKGSVPVKFQLMDANGNYVEDKGARISLKMISNNPAGDEVEATSTSAATEGDLFRYVLSDHQHIYNLGLKILEAGSYQIGILLSDGTTHTVNIGLLK
jgi:uncharacterized repeat protein (TIGR01451 family)